VIDNIFSWYGINNQYFGVLPAGTFLYNNPALFTTDSVSRHVSPAAGGCASYAIGARRRLPMIGSPEHGPRLAYFACRQESIDDRARLSSHSLRASNCEMTGVHKEPNAIAHHRAALIAIYLRGPNQFGIGVWL
jgi:hypothetical protein